MHEDADKDSDSDDTAHFHVDTGLSSQVGPTVLKKITYSNEEQILGFSDPQGKTMLSLDSQIICFSIESSYKDWLNEEMNGLPHGVSQTEGKNKCTVNQCTWN